MKSLIVTCPNAKGGIHIFNENSCLLKIADFQTTGIFYDENFLSVGLQPDLVLLVLDISECFNGKIFRVKDIHDIILYDSKIYFVETESNSILRLDINGVCEKKWSFGSDIDSCHVNCLGVWNGNVVYSAFGDFKKNREYKGNTSKSGFVRDLYSGQLLISGLSQPHSLKSYKSNLLLCNSETSELMEFSIGEKLIRCLKLEGYLRGLLIRGECAYVGKSKSRNPAQNLSNVCGVYKINMINFSVVDFTEIDSEEIYDIAEFLNTEKTMSDICRSFSLLASYSSHKLWI